MVPVRTAAEQDLAQSWLSDPAGFRVRLDELLGLAPADPNNQLTSFLTRAATVTVLRYGGVVEGGALEQVRAELTTGRRAEWATAAAEPAPLLAAGQVAPQPTNVARRLMLDPTCANR